VGLLNRWLAMQPDQRHERNRGARGFEPLHIERHGLPAASDEAVETERLMPIQQPNLSGAYIDSHA
jgi:hypothetical protein